MKAAFLQRANSDNFSRTRFTMGNAFSFNVTEGGGLVTGGGGGGSGTGSGVIAGIIASPENDADGVNNAGNEMFFADEAYGSALANGFGFGVGSGVAITNGGEQAGGAGGGSGLGQGAVTFELDDVNTATLASSGDTTSIGGASGFVGLFDPLPAAQIFGAFTFTPPSADTP
jgi:hypothetical protein